VDVTPLTGTYDKGLCCSKTFLIFMLGTTEGKKKACPQAGFQQEVESAY
jgi:hypothetical protein